jgi:hypothetical protein
MWNLFAPDKLGYHEKVVTERSLKERMLLAWRTDPDAVRNLLRRNGVSYQIDSCGDFMRFVAFLDKPLAELLDEIRVPRERIDNRFIEFEGPLPYNPNRIKIRRIVPGLIAQPKGFTVQPMTEHISNLPIMTELDIFGIWPLGSPEAWNEVSAIAQKLSDSQKN